MRKLLIIFLSFITISVYASINVTFTLTGDGVKEQYLLPCVLGHCDNNSSSVKNIKPGTKIIIYVNQASVLGDYYFKSIQWDTSCNSFYLDTKMDNQDDSDKLYYPHYVSSGNLHITATSKTKDGIAHISNCRTVFSK